MKKQRFSQMLSILKGTNIGLFLQNGQFVEGVLLDVKPDHLIVHVNNNIFYIATHQILAFSKNAKDYRVNPAVVPYVDRVYFTDILTSLKYNWVTINGLNNQTFTGLLATIMEDYIVLINDEEQLFIQRPLISNILNGIYETKDQNNQMKENVVQAPLLDDDELSNRLESTQEEIRNDAAGELIVENQGHFSIESDVSESPETSETYKEEADHDEQHSIWQTSSIAECEEAPIEESGFVFTEDVSSILDKEPIDTIESSVIGDFIEEKPNGYKGIPMEENPREADTSTSKKQLHDGSATNMTSEFNEDHSIHKGLHESKHYFSNDWPLNTNEENELLTQTASCILKKCASVKKSTLSNPMWNHKKQKAPCTPPKERIIKDDSVQSSEMKPEEERKMLRMQYYSLMKHAERMYLQLSEDQ